MLKYIRFLLTVTLVFVFLSAPPTVYASPIVAHPGNLQGWVIRTFGLRPEFADFVQGPGTPLLGAGSYRVKVKTGQKITLGRKDYRGTPLFNLEISYSTYPPGIGNDWYVNIYVNTTGGSGLANCRLDFAPYLSTSPSSWITYYPMSARSGWFTASAGNGTCPAIFSYPTYPAGVSFDDILDAFPDAVLRPDYPGNPVIVFNMGDFLDYDGAIDAITINGTIWDFEPTAPTTPASADFDPSVCSVDPRPGDRLAICCETNRIAVYGVGDNGRPFLLSTFDFEDLAKAGPGGIYIDKKLDGVISASMGK
ncbi:MAG: hypothetical protein SNJ58_02915, partial [Aggregatilineales bacterium]